MVPTFWVLHAGHAGPHNAVQYGFAALLVSIVVVGTLYHIGVFDALRERLFEQGDDE